MGKGRRLSQEKSDEIKTAIVEHTPDYFKLQYSLWSRETIKEFIRQKYGVEMPLTTITDYLQHWEMTCQRPAKRAKTKCSGGKRISRSHIPQNRCESEKWTRDNFIRRWNRNLQSRKFSTRFFSCRSCSRRKIARQKRKNQYDFCNKSAGPLWVYVLPRDNVATTFDWFSWKIN